MLRPLNLRLKRAAISVAVNDKAARPRPRHYALRHSAYTRHEVCTTPSTRYLIEAEAARKISSLCSKPDGS